MTERIDLTGQRFGRWAVLAFGVPGKNSTWLCRCDCGAEAWVQGNNLRSGKTTSCGCYKRELLAANDSGRGRKPDHLLSYGGAHERVRKERGPARAHACVDCLSDAQDWSLKANPTQVTRGVKDDGRPCTYSPNPDDYEPRCRKCHRALDGYGGDVRLRPAWVAPD